MALKSFSTPLGVIGILWESDSADISIRRIFLPPREAHGKHHDTFQSPENETVRNRTIDELASAILRYCSGQDVLLNPEVLDMNILEEFQKAVLTETCLIPRGKVISYGRLAEKSGSSGASRAAGTALARNPFPLIIPCHRVIRSSGEIGHFGGGSSMKKRLLEMEGVRFSRQGRVDTSCMWE